MPRIYLSPPHLSGRELEYLKNAVDSNWVAPLGPQVDAFEQELAELVDVPNALALSSGTAALHLAAQPGVSGLIARSPTPLQQTAMRHGWWNLWLIAAPVAVQIPSDLDSVKNAKAASVPAVFLITAKDTLVTPPCQRMVIDAYRGEKRTVVLAEAGHNSPLEEFEVREYEAALSWLYEKALKKGR